MADTFKSINPYDQSVIAEYKIFDGQQIENALKQAEGAFHTWKNTSFKERSDLLKNVAGVLRKNAEVYAKIISLEMGKVLKESLAEVEKCAWNCAYYAENGESFLKDEVIPSDAQKSLVVFEPIGAIFAIMPWNFPFWQVFRFAAPSLMAGNVVLLKHAPNVCGCAVAMEEIFLEAGLPAHVFQSLIADIDKTEQIIAHDIVQGVTLTGSEAAGSSVAALAGKHIKKSVMELGGSDPLIVLKDADLPQAAKISLTARFQNAGQSCIAAKRFIVDEKIKDEFLVHLIEEIKKLKQGDPLDPQTTIGPMARMDLADKLEKQEMNSLNKGALVLYGGRREGCNFQPTILNHIKPGMPAFDEELFGPIASIIEAKNEAEIIALANNSRYGLGAAIFTKDTDKAFHIARKINSGSVFINAMVKSDPRLPFGGTKKSGYGRELSHYGMKEFTNIKTIYMNA